MRISSAKCSLAVIPMALLGAGLILTHGRGPYYLRNNFDPEYIYLLNSLSLLTFHAPAHTDHPGTTLQVLGAIVVFFQWVVRFLVVDRQPLSASVLAHSEEYLRSINLLLNVLISGALYWCAWSIYRLSRSLVAALLLQGTVLIYLQTFLAITGVSPEPLLIASCLVLMVPLASMVLGGGETAAKGNRLAVAAGAMFGFGLITKITFAPLAAVILLFPKSSQKWRFAAATLAASVVFLLPVAVRFPTMATWFTSLLTHEGHYGTGRVGIPGAHELAENFLSLWRDEPLLFGFLGLYAVVLVLLPVFERQGILAAKRARPTLLIACLAIVAQTAMVVKHPSTHYLLPALILTAFANAALWAMLPRPEFGSPMLRRICLAVLGALVAIGLAHNAWAIGVWTDSVRTDRRNLAELRSFEDTLQGCQIIGTYRSSQPIYALSFASDYSAAVHRETLERVYPRAIHYDPFSHRFLSFGYVEMTGDVKRRITSGECILLEGTQLDPSILKQLLSEGIRFTPLMTLADPISPSDATTLYRLQPGGQP